MNSPAPKSDADEARATLRHPYGSTDQAQAWATLALADSIRAAAGILSAALVEAARIRAGARR